MFLKKHKKLIANICITIIVLALAVYNFYESNVVKSDSSIAYKTIQTKTLKNTKKVPTKNITKKNSKKELNPKTIKQKNKKLSKRNNKDKKKKKIKPHKDCFTPHVIYHGENGYSALELLEEHCYGVVKTTYSSSVPGYLVTEIGGQGNGLIGPWWIYSVNDAGGSVGAADYITNNSDIIEWTLKSFN